MDSLQQVVEMEADLEVQEEEEQIIDNYEDLIIYLHLGLCNVPSSGGGWGR